MTATGGLCDEGLFHLTPPEMESRWPLVSALPAPLHHEPHPEELLVLAAVQRVEEGLEVGQLANGGENLEGIGKGYD